MIKNDHMSGTPLKTYKKISQVFKEKLLNFVFCHIYVKFHSIIAAPKFFYPKAYFWLFTTVAVAISMKENNIIANLYHHAVKIKWNLKASPILWQFGKLKV